jgi:hypothetical protein
VAAKRSSGRVRLYKEMGKGERKMGKGGWGKGGRGKRRVKRIETQISVTKILKRWEKGGEKRRGVMTD